MENTLLNHFWDGIVVSQMRIIRVSKIKKRKASKTAINIHYDCFNKRKGSGLGKKVVENKPGMSVNVSNQISNKDLYDNSNNIIIFGDNITKDINY